jgi:2-polyprenyl-3-methyl-5-hydroxy-6-metoxy-1,4-benzoquinol methylase
MAAEAAKDSVEQFAERYRVSQTDVTRAIERNVIGGDWGANGFTTIAQADLLAEVLHLGPDKVLLDVGSGRGWPGLYLSHRTGCHVVATDLPLEALQAARTKVGIEGLQQQAAIIRCGAGGLPFRAGVFHALVHTDVLC